MTTLLFLVLILLALYVVVQVIYNMIDYVNDARHYTFEDMKFSTQEFYTLAANLIKEKGIPGVKLGRIYHSTKGMLSVKREYLRVVYQEYFFDICAAPFANDFFVSWRQGELKRIAIGKRRFKTFYEQDTELMFKDSIKMCVDRAIEQITESKGIRLPDAEISQVVQITKDRSAQLTEA